ncbi:MAG: type II toxin-antitoxin system RelE/ParE family toxin [Chitinophagaceae bacterium]|nr:type II toxin-antitoxin system RelE/ParE family toxin [Chitinophagaceae bacterium]
MEIKKRQLVWTGRAEKNMYSLYKYISKDSPQNAEKVLKDIIVAAEKSPRDPEYYAPDKYKRNNDGSYRAFEKHKYRIAYRVNSKIIRILFVKHTKRLPKEY